MKLKCPKCDYEKDVNDLVSDCPKCGLIAPHFMVNYDLEHVAKTLTKKALKKRTKDIWRYFELFPLKYDKNLFKIRIGNTPLEQIDKLSNVLGIKNIYVKDETLMPTLSFKDRGGIIIAAHAAQNGTKKLTVASSGNFGAAVARYCSLFGIECIMLTADDTPKEKLAKSAMYGAKIVRVHGLYRDCRRLCIEASDNLVIHSASWEHKPTQIEGWKTSGFEIVEQLHWNSPNIVLVPTGGGGNLLGIWKGICEFKELGFIDSLPKMVAVQSTGCSPYLEAFEKGYVKPRPFKNPKTVAKGIRSSDPFEGEYALKAIRDSKGIVVAVTDEEIIEAGKLLASTTGILAEPSGAASIAGAKKMKEEGIIQSDDVVVSIITGNAMNDFESYLPLVEKSHHIDPSFKEFKKII